MPDLESYGVISHCANLSIDLLYDETKMRPILQVSQTFGNSRRFTLRYAISPASAMPSWLLEDTTATFLVALADMVRHQFGIQEELELRLSTDLPQEQAQ
jgi:hypothetical protein